MDLTPIRRLVGLCIGFVLLVGAGLVVWPSSQADASTTPAWTCVMPGPSPAPTPSPSSTPTATPTATDTPTPPVVITPQLQIAGPHIEIDETRTLVQVQLKTPDGFCLSGKVTLWEKLNDTWRPWGAVTIGTSGTTSVWVSARVTTLWRAYAASTPTTNAVWSTYFILHNYPPKPVITTPSWLPHPISLPRQGYAVGHGPNALITTIPDDVWNQMAGVSWHAGCPVGRASLRLMTVNYWGFDGYRRRGSLIIAAWAAHDFVGAFGDLYWAAVPIRAMYRVDTFGYSSVTHGANDYSSMAHDNTSAFNCRWVDGSPGVLSPHAYGAAVDLNTYENPYDSATGWTPNGQWAGIRINPYAWRVVQDRVVSIMRAHGFSWTYGTADPQHFDAH